MGRRTPDAIPTDHRRAERRFLGVTEDGLEFDLEVGSTRRRVGSGDLVKAQMNAMARGRPLSGADLYREEPEVVLFIKGRRRVDIRVNPNGSYSVGHRHSRSLREIVEGSLSEFAPHPSPGLR